MRIKKILLILGIAVWTGGCVSTEPKIVEIDPNDIPHLENKYDTKDMNNQAVRTVESLLQHKVITDNPRPRIMLGKIKIDDNLDEDIDLGAIQKTIQYNLNNSKLAEFVDVENRELLKEEIDYQNDSDYINRSTVTEKGYFKAAEYILSGRLSKNFSSNNQQSVVVYTLFMTLTSIKTSTIVWQGRDRVVKQIQ